MAPAPKPLDLQPYSDPSGRAPKPVSIAGLGDPVEAQEAPTIDSTPADPAAVAADLQSVVDALVAAGVFTEA